jgi:hypothetical protein
VDNYSALNRLGQPPVLLLVAISVSGKFFVCKGNGDLGDQCMVEVELIDKGITQVIDNVIDMMLGQITDTEHPTSVLDRYDTAVHLVNEPGHSINEQVHCSEIQGIAIVKLIGATIPTSEFTELMRYWTIRYETACYLADVLFTVTVVAVIRVDIADNELGLSHATPPSVLGVEQSG